MTVSVGFAPTTTPGTVAGGTTAAPEAATPEGLFAALLALVAPGSTADAATVPETITSTDFSALLQQVSPTAAGIAADTEAEEVPVGDPAVVVSPIAELPDTEQGKSLLKDLSDALIAINDALEAGTPVDPALEKKLSEAVDAVAAYLGVTITPAAPTVDPRISALASGEGVLPPTAPADLPPAPADLPATEPVPTDPSAIEAAALEQVPEPTPVDDSVSPATPAVEPVEVADEIPVVDDLPADPPEPVAPVVAAPAPQEPETATILEPPPALGELGVLIGKLSQRLEPTDPVLAKKLAALADGLQSGTLSEEKLTALGIDATDDDPDLARVIEALSAPRSAAKPAVEAQPFTVPTLVLPDAIAPAKNVPETDTAASVLPAPTRLEPTQVELSKPAPVATVERDAGAVDKSPPPAASAAALPDTGTSAEANAATVTQQPAAAPVARTIHAAYQAPVQQVNLPQVAFEVVRQFDAGNSRFQIRLDPPELGRIDVKLDVDKSGTVNARMTVERPETLDLMQRDQRALQQALQQAGLDASRTNLEFSLRQNPFAAQGGMSDGRGQQQGSGGGGNFGTEEASTEAATTLYRGTATAGGINLIV